MLPEDLQIVSVDDHVIEHPRVWLDRVSSKYGDAVPHIERADDGNDWWIYEGAQAGNFALNAVVGKPYEEFGVEPRTYDDMLPGCHDVAERIKDMDKEGVWAQLCFPNMGGFAGRVFWQSKDPELGVVCVQAYNDWITDEWCAYDPDRQIPLVMLPFWDVEASVEELHRTIAKGARSATFIEAPHRLGLPSFHSDHWDPLFAAAQEANCPLSLHFGSGGPELTMAPDANYTVSIAMMGMNSMAAMIDLMLSPVFHKFPRLKVALSEGGIGWMPYALERADYTWNRHRWYNDVNKDVPPSKVFRDHIYGCFISDYAGVQSRYLIGVDNIMFESDYPHSDCNWPNTRKVLEEMMAGVPDDEVHKILEDNARKLYNFPRNPNRWREDRSPRERV